MSRPNDKLLREFDWAQSPLGARSTWSAEMNAAIGMIMASGFPMCTVWGDQRIQIYNDAYNSIYGAKHPASFGKPARDSWPEIWEFLGPALDQVMKTAETLWFAETLLPLVKSSRPEECYFDFSYSPVSGKDGTVEGVLSVAAERTSEVILGRRRKLAALDAARVPDATFDVLMQTLHDVLAENEMDCAAAVLYSVAPETGMPDGEIWSLRASLRLIRAVRPLAARALRHGSIGVHDATKERNEPATVICIPFFGLEGEPCCSLAILPNELVSLESTALPFAEAISTGIHAVLHAAEQRRHEIVQIRDQLTIQEMLYRSLFNDVRVGVAYCATTGVPTDDEVILAVNPWLCQMLGYTAEELVGMSRDALLFPDDVALSAALAKRGADKHFTGELLLRGKDGRKVPVELTSNLIEFSKGQTRSLSIIRDISLRRALEEQQAERLRLETVANLAGSLAHDTNNLMTIVIGSTEFLADRLPAGGIEQQMAVNAMVAAERASGLTNQLLIYSRQQPLEPRPIDLNAFLDEIRPLILSALGEINSLAIGCEADLPPCMADPAQLTTALLNLVTNARHAMPDCGTLSLETFLRAGATFLDPSEPGQHFVGLRVKDTGTGIPLDIQGRVFEPFFTTKEVGSGSGLGLSIVQRLIDDLGGTLEMCSTPGSGTTFELCFPIAETAAAEVDRAEPEGRAQGEAVLYVEDNETVRRQTERMLRQIGVMPIVFGTAREALEWVRGGGRANILISDLVLPGGMSGLELAKEARRHQPDLPVLIVTGYDPRAILAKERNRHFPVLRKPYTRRGLAAALLRELRQATGGL